MLFEQYADIDAHLALGQNYDVAIFTQSDGIFIAGGLRCSCRISKMEICP